MEMEANIDKLKLTGLEAGEQPEASEASPDAKKTEELKRVDQALRDLAPHMEKFKDADKSALETHAHSQIEALEAELGTKLGQESVDLIHHNLVTEVLARKESLQSTTKGLKEEKGVLEGAAEKKLGPEEQKFNWRINQFSTAFMNGEVPQFFKRFIQSRPSEQAYEDATKRLGAIYKEYVTDKQAGEEQVKMYTERLKALAAELNASVEAKPAAVSAGAEAEPVASEVKNVDLTPEEQAERAAKRAEEARVHVEASMAGMVTPEAAVFDAKPVEASSSDDESEEEDARSSSDTTGTDAGGDAPTAEDEAEAKENINHSAVEETIINLVKSPETVLGEEQAEEKGPSQEKGVKMLLEALGSMYNDKDELVGRLKEIFGNYKIAWAHDRRVRPGLSEAAHKKMALEDITRDLPMKEAQAIEHLLQGQQTGEGEAKGLSKDVMMKNFIELIEEKSHIASPDTSSLDAADSSTSTEE